jgi:hypothetical protein
MQSIPWNDVVGAFATLATVTLYTAAGGLWIAALAQGYARNKGDAYLQQRTVGFFRTLTPVVRIGLLTGVLAICAWINVAPAAAWSVMVATPAVWGVTVGAAIVCGIASEWRAGWVAAGAAAVAMAGAAQIQSSMLASPMMVLGIVYQVAGSFALGGAWIAGARWVRDGPRFGDQGQGDVDVRTRLVRVAWFGGAAALAMLTVFGVWEGSGAWTDPLIGVPLDFSAQGSRVQRLATVAMTGWVSFLVAAAALGFAGRIRRGRAWVLLAFGALSVGAADRARSALAGPWAVPGRVYVNGTTVDEVRFDRRATADRDRAEGVFARQCGACHARQGAWRRYVRVRGLDWTRSALLLVREADQMGSPYRNAMPPLRSDDARVEELARWLVGGDE